MTENPSTAPTIINVDEEYPSFRILREARPGAVSIDVDADAAARWQSVIDAYDDVRAEIAKKVTAVTGDPYYLD